MDDGVPERQGKSRDLTLAVTPAQMPEAPWILEEAIAAGAERA
ncbi:hypothetical protein OKW33_006730 [Paraburkholderia atlantica]|nr:hypothetical protein [Paraburkholderia atlantica]